MQLCRFFHFWLKETSRGFFGDHLIGSIFSWSESGLWDEDYNKIVLTLFDADLRYWLTMLVLNEFSDSEIRAVSEVFSHVVISNPHFYLQLVFISQRYFVDVSLCWAIYLGMQTEELELGGVGVSQPTSNSYKVSMKMSNVWWNELLIHYWPSQNQPIIIQHFCLGRVIAVWPPTSVKTFHALLFLTLSRPNNPLKRTLGFCWNRRSLLGGKLEKLTIWEHRYFIYILRQSLMFLTISTSLLLTASLNASRCYFISNE